MTEISLPTAAEMSERLAGWCERYGVAGATVGWMNGDRTEFASAGVVNRRTGVETTPDSVFQIGSITKVYTTTLIMQLAEEGKLSLDDPAIKHLPGLRFADPEQSRQVTIRHFLTHTSGVDGDFFDDFGRGDDAITRYVAACSKLPFMFPVGSMWSYCNVGFVVLGRIVETLTGMTWEAALKERVLGPLGASSTMTFPEEALRYRTALGHFGLVPDGPAPAGTWGMPRAQAPAGSTPCSTVEDLLKFARLHIDGGVTADGTRLLSAESVEEMQRPQFTLPEHPGEGANHWGLGWMLFDWGGRQVIGHDGGTIGQNSSLRISPADNFAVAVLTNTSPTGSVLATRVMRWLFSEHMAIEIPPAARPPETPAQFDLAPYTGTFEKHESRFEISLVDGRLSVQMTNTGPLGRDMPQQPPITLVPVSETLMLQNPVPGYYTPVTFSHFEDGRPQYVFASRVFRRTA